MIILGAIKKQRQPVNFSKEQHVVLQWMQIENTLSLKRSAIASDDPYFSFSPPTWAKFIQSNKRQGGQKGHICINSDGLEGQDPKDGYSLHIQIPVHGIVNGSAPPTTPHPPPNPQTQLPLPAGCLKLKF